MKFVSDPSIPTKIQKMRQRVRWRDPVVLHQGIDQTQLVLEDGKDDNPEFSFLVIGDSGSGAHRGHNPQRQIAEGMLQHRDESRFILHTGDVIYLVGSSEYYLKNFIEPYREFLVGGDRPEKIPFNQMVFNLPFLPVPGNHDYYDLPIVLGMLAKSFSPLSRLLNSKIDFDVGWHGSKQGKAYAQAFLDYLIDLPTDQALLQHLDRHYTATCDQGRCLRYQPKQFTRLPNRYYSFRSGGIDFFALDSNTFNAPSPLPNDEAGRAYRQLLEQRRSEVVAQKEAILQQFSQPRLVQSFPVDHLDDLRTKLEQLEEVERDIDQQLEMRLPPEIDVEQLTWLKQRLIESWHNSEVRGRVLFFHHPPYVTEATKWHQAQTLAVRQRLRQVFTEVAIAVPDRAGRPLVDLVLNGHAHCLEHLRTVDTAMADANINWIVCGGSGYSLRRQRVEGIEIRETLLAEGKVDSLYVAQSQLYIGRTGQGSEKRRPYSFIRIDVQDGCPPRFVVRPYIAERYHGKWHQQELPSFKI
ncbi:MAG TPA: metallophosphoesterase [Trichocoleus sp.]|jgi:3',5'-cyclic AMP phosphodiesterase CpdA